MASLCHKVKLRKVVKGWKHGLRGSIVYCKGETSTNLSSRTASTDLGFRRREADTMMLSAHAKLPKSSCSRQRWHRRRVRESSKCLASPTRESADQKQKWVYQLLCRALRRCSKHHHASPCNHRQWPHVSLASMAMAKRNCCNKWSVIQRRESSSNGQVNWWESGVTKQSESW